MGYYDPETDETPEERRMRLLAEMGSPFLGNRPDADLGTVDSGGVLGFMPQGSQPSGPAQQLGSPYLQDLVQRDFSGARPGMTNDLVQRDFSGPPPGALQPLGDRSQRDWVDPGVTPSGSGRDYTDPPPRLGNFFRKPGEPAQPELDGILFNGTRSIPGRDILAKETPAAAIPSGPVASPDDTNVQGANNQDRSNAPKPPDAPKTSAPISIPSLVGVAAPAVPAAPTAPAPQGAAGNPLPQPQVAAVADGLSRKPGSPAAMDWLEKNADLFIAIGASLLSGRNIGEGIIHGLKAANDAKATNAKIKAQEEANIAENLKKSAHANLLMKRFGMTPEQAIAMADDTDLVKRAQQAEYPDPKSGPEWQVETLPDGTKVQRNLNTNKLEAAPKPEEAERPLTDPAERAKWHIPPEDKRPYSVKGNQAPKVLGGAGQTINVNTGQDKLVEIAAKQFEGHIGAVDNARRTLEATAAMRDQLNAPGGVITGAAAGDRLALQKVASLFGVADPSAITNTESLKAAAGPLVLATVKGLGAGSGISNADREFAERIAGGSASLDETSIRRLIDIQERAATASMTRSQGVIQQLIQTNPNLVNLAPLLTAPPPEARPPAASQSAPPAPSAAPPGMPAPAERHYDRNGRLIR